MQKKNISFPLFFHFGLKPEAHIILESFLLYYNRKQKAQDSFLIPYWSTTSKDTNHCYYNSFLGIFFDSIANIATIWNI